MPPQEAPLTPREALESIGEVARRDEALKARTEGLTWVIWGFSNAGITFTYLALVPDAAAIPDVLAVPPWYIVAATSWVIAGLFATIGLWRSAALSFPTGMRRERAVAFFVAWPLLTALLTFIAIPLVGWENGVLAKTVAVGVLLLGFGWLNPLGFTGRGRASAGLLGTIAVAMGLAGLLLALDPRGSLLLVGAALGGAWAIVGLFAVYRG